MLTPERIEELWRQAVRDSRKNDFHDLTRVFGQLIEAEVREQCCLRLSEMADDFEASELNGDSREFTYREVAESCVAAIRAGKG